MDWKKEIKLSDLVGRKNRSDDAVPAEQSLEVEGTPEKTSIWKKEISFGRRKAEPPAEAPSPQVGAASAAAAEPAVQPDETPVLPAAVPPVEAQPSAAAAPPVELPAPLASSEPISPSPESPVAPPAHVDGTSASPPVQPPPVVTVTGEPDVQLPAADAALPPVGPPEAPPVASTTEVPQPLPPTQAEAPPRTEATAATPLSPPAITPPPPPHAAAMPPTSAAEEIPASPVVPPALPEPAAQPAAAPAPPVAAPEPPGLPPSPPPSPAQPEVVHPPVPADKLPPKEDKGKRTPFYKREISFGRKPAGVASSNRTRARRGVSVGRGKTSKSLVGLKIGASQIAAARVANNGHAELLQVAREPLQPGIVVGGELRDPDSLAEALKEFFGKHKLPKRGVRLGIANNRIGVRAFELAGIEDPRQLSNAIRFRAQEALPIPIEDAVLDYQVLAERVTDEGETIRRILLVVAYRELVDRYVDACRKAGITLVGIDLEGFALLRSLQAPNNEPVGDAAMVAVTIGHERTTFAVSEGRMCEFTRVLEWGGSALNVAIARALDMAPGEAEPIKLELSLGGGEVPEGLTEAQAAAARAAMAGQIQAFARELVSSLQFYQNQPGSLGIGEIAITGGTAHLPGLAQELQRLIGVTVRVGDPLARVKTAKKFREPEQVGSLAVAIGLGIDD